MKKNTLRQKLKKLGYSDSMIRALLNGSKKPSLDKAIELRDKQSIPVEVWLDIKSFINESITDTTDSNEVQEIK